MTHRLISADASSYGLGAVLFQRAGNPSRALSVTEGRYTQIEKAALAVTWACERFSTYLLKRHFSWKLTTNH